MSLSMLIMGPELEAEVRRVLDYAEKPENWYRVDKRQKPPGDNPAHVLHSGNFKVVFSYTAGGARGPVVRHLSVSTSNPGANPNLITVAVLCDLFGFTGAPRSGGLANGLAADWVTYQDGPAIAIQQLVPPAHIQAPPAPGQRKGKPPQLPRSARPR